MAYVKQTWVDGTSIVDADKLNHIEDGIYNANLNTDYSTSEIDTGKTWIDGKHIYRKVIDIGNLPNSTSANIAHNITNIGIFTSIKGVANVGNPINGNSFPLPFVVETNMAQCIRLYANDTNVIIATGSDRSSWYGYAILEYTKTS